MMLTYRQSSSAMRFFKCHQRPKIWRFNFEVTHALDAYMRLIMNR